MNSRLLVALLTAVALLGGAPLTVPAQPAGRLVVQSQTEPPGLDMTATPATATSGIVFYNVQSRW